MEDKPVNHEEQRCCNCKHFAPDETGDGFCSCPVKSHYHDYVSGDEYCVTHEIKEKHEKRQ